MSISTILNARCRTANGLQLLLSFMLIAQATSKQVKKDSYNVCMYMYIHILLTIACNLNLRTCIYMCSHLQVLVFCQAITVLNNAGVCVSYQRAWDAQRGNAPYAELFCTRAIAQCAHA